MADGTRKRDTAAQRRSDYRALFVDHPAGPRTLHRLMRRGHFLEVTTVAGDPGSSGFRDGRRSMVSEILRDMGLGDEQVMKMATEQDSET